MEETDIIQIIIKLWLEIIGMKINTVCIWNCIIDHFTPTKMTKTSNLYLTKYCGVCGTIGPLNHCWWECNMAVSSKVKHTVITVIPVEGNQSFGFWDIDF